MEDVKLLAETDEDIEWSCKMQRDEIAALVGDAVIAAVKGAQPAVEGHEDEPVISFQIEGTDRWVDVFVKLSSA